MSLAPVEEHRWGVLKRGVTLPFVVKESRGGETRFVCHWLCLCSLRDVDKRFSTGRASGTQKETDNVVLQVL